MLTHTKITQGCCGIFGTLFMMVVSIIFVSAPLLINAQSPSPTPTSDEKTYDGYKIYGSAEFGWRWRWLNGDENKYRSDLNYKQGFRSFDSSILLESESGKGKFFDSLLITNSGWGSDPSGLFHVSIEKTGIYKYNSTVRRISYFNNLSNHALGEHTQNTRNMIGDYDLTILPQNRLIRFNFGVSSGRYDGPAVTTIEPFRDSFATLSTVHNNSTDYRIGAEGTVLGFDWGINGGSRRYRDRSIFEINSFNPGNDTTNFATVSSFSRTFPTKARSNYGQFFVHRAVADRFDFTCRLIYSSTRSTSTMLETTTGRDFSNNFIDLDTVTVNGNANRPQTRGDLGITYAATHNFRVSNTFTFDQFAVNTGNSFQERVDRRNPAGNPLSAQFTSTQAYRVNAYRRFSNLLEGDYQFNNRVSAHLGWRYSRRSVRNTGYDLNLLAPLSTTNPNAFDEPQVNTTNTVIAGMKIKPIKIWSIFWDVEHGTADNIFTRLENYKFTNYRVRTRLTAKKVTFDASYISKDNSNPSVQLVLPSTLDVRTDIKSRNIAGNVTWDPISEVSVSAGYTFRRLTTYTPVLMPINNVYTYGFSQFFIRDHYTFVDVSIRPTKRVGLYAAYRYNNDTGQGNRVSTVLSNFINSYPIKFTSPEIRGVIRLTRNLDWNIGYQYYDYKDIQTPSLNYRAHLPYTSLRIYFGNGAADR